MISVWEKRITTVTAVPVLLVTVSPNQVAVSQRAASSVLSTRAIGSASRSRRTTFRPGIGAGQRRHRWRGFAARAARWLTLLQTPRGSQCGPSSWASRSACPIGTSPNLTPRERADQWRRYRRPSGYRATDKTGSQFRTSVDPVGRSGCRRVANRRDVAGRNLDFVGHVGGHPSNSAGLRQAVLPDIPWLSGPATAIVDGSKPPGDGCRWKPKR